jgi:hypothetical protein
LLEQKAPKIQGFIKMLAFLNRRYLLAIQGMIHSGTAKHLSLLCIATHMPSSHTSGKNRWRIFLMPVAPKQDFAYREFY